LGADHQGHVRPLQLAAEAMGVEPERLNIIIGQLVTLRRGEEAIKISKRSGDIVTLREVVEEVGRDACLFFFLSRSADAAIDFDLELAKRQSAENPVYYVQYAHARIASILRTGIEDKLIDPAEVRNGLWAGAYDPARIGPDEVALLKVARQFRRMVEIAARELDPAVMAEYLRTLSGAYQQYYELGRDPARKALCDDEPLRRARLAVGAAIQQLLRNGFRLLGLSAPERM
jgi:arginyl-tRNA synthetase